MSDNFPLRITFPFFEILVDLHHLFLDMNSMEKEKNLLIELFHQKIDGTRQLGLYHRIKI